MERGAPGAHQLASIVCLPASKGCLPTLLNGPMQTAEVGVAEGVAQQVARGVEPIVVHV